MPTVSLKDAYELAVRHQKAGDLAYAETVYRHILAAQPNHLDSLKMLAELAYQTGRREMCAELLQAAITIDPSSAELRGNLGTMLALLNRPAEAVEQFRIALSLRPNAPDALNNLGNALVTLGRVDEAIEAFQQAVRINPQLGNAWNNLGTALAKVGRAQEAVAALRQAIALQPDAATTWLNFGLALSDAELFTEAADAFRKVIAMQPDHVEGLTGLGSALWELGRPDEAIIPLREALRLQPDYPEALVNFANCLSDGPDPQIAVELFRRAMRSGQPLPTAEWNLGLLLLRGGDLKEGLQLYEARRRLPRLRCNADFPQPMWDGGPLDGRTILLHAEQGLGDTMQFVRYVPLVKSRGGRVIVRCQPPLRRLLEGQCGIEHLISDGDSLPPFDLHCPLMSLARVFGTTVDSIPADVPYLHADAAHVERWREILSNEPAGLKVGLVWAGSPGNKNDWRRSIPLSMLAPLGEVPEVRLHSLQIGEAAKQAHSPPAGMEVRDWSEQLADFVDTAGLIANLDLVISVDTAVAHLAGAMGRPDWLLLPKRADWRWMRERTDSPWYPTMRLFRQQQTGDWAYPIQRVAEELAARAQCSAGPAARDTGF